MRTGIELAQWLLSIVSQESIKEALRREANLGDEDLGVFLTLLQDLLELIHFSLSRVIGLGNRFLLGFFIKGSLIGYVLASLVV